MIDCIILIKRTSGQDLEAYTRYRLEWEQRTKAKSIGAGRKGGNGSMAVKTAIAKQPHPTNVVWAGVLNND